MKLKNIKGREVYKNCLKYKVDWDGKCRSKVQFAVKRFIKKYWQFSVVYEEFPVYGSRMSVDIINFSKKIAIEVDGRHHGRYVAHFCNNNRANFLSQIKRDVSKEEWLEMNGIKLVRITEDEVRKMKTQEDFDIFYNEHIK